MARAKSKEELIIAANVQYQKMMNLIDSMSNEDLEKKFSFNIEKENGAHWKRDKNIRDVLIHVYEWHQLLLNWIEANLNGDPKPFLLEPYTWKTYGDMNIEFWKKHQSTTYLQAKELVTKSHSSVMELINEFSNEKLFEKKVYDWVGGTTLGSYFISCTSGHYDWAIKKINKHIKSL